MPSFRIILNDFIGHLRLENGLEAKTAKAYASDLEIFFNYLADRDINAPEDITRDIIIDFLEHSLEAGLESTTIARRLISIKVFFRFLTAEHVIPTDITQVIENPRLWKLIPEFLSIDEVDALLKAYKDSDPLSIRNRAILETLYASGLRVSELTGLRLDGIHFNEGFLRIIGKRNKERIVPFGLEAQEAMERYLKEARPFLNKTGQALTFFISHHGKPLTRERVWMIVTDAARIAGIEKTVYPHILRHSFASHLLNNGADLRVIQEMLGHTSVATTQIYTHTDFSRIAEAHRRFHPRS